MVEEEGAEEEEVGLGEDEGLVEEGGEGEETQEAAPIQLSSTAKSVCCVVSDRFSFRKQALSDGQACLNVKWCSRQGRLCVLT